MIVNWAHPDSSQTGLPVLGYRRGDKAPGNGSNPVSTGFAEALAHSVLRHRVTVRYSIGGARVGKQGHVVGRGLVQREGRPWRVIFTPAPGYTLKVIAYWAMSNLAPGWTVLSYSLVRLNGVAATALALDFTGSIRFVRNSPPDALCRRANNAATQQRWGCCQGWAKSGEGSPFLRPKCPAAQGLGSGCDLLQPTPEPVRRRGLASPRAGVTGAHEGLSLGSDVTFHTKWTKPDSGRSSFMASQERN